MELKLKNGDYVSDGAGGLQRACGGDALLQRVLFRLTAKRGRFPFQEELGSRLWQLGRLGGGERQSAAKQFVAEALAAEPDVQVLSVTLTSEADGRAALTIELEWQGERLLTTLEIQG